MFRQLEVLGLRTFLYAISALCLPEMYLLVEEATPAAEGIELLCFCVCDCLSNWLSCWTAFCLLELVKSIILSFFFKSIIFSLCPDALPFVEFRQMVEGMELTLDIRY